MSTTPLLSASKTISRASTLPTEVLFMIFSYLKTPSEPQGSFLSEWLPLTQVCQTWKTVAEILIFSKLVYRNEKHDGRRVRRLFDHMDRKPYLWRYPRSLHMSICTYGDSYRCADMARKAIEHESPVHKARFECKFYPHGLPEFESLSRLPLVELDLCTMQWGLPIHLIFELFDLPTLKTLRLGHIVWSQAANSKLSGKRVWHVNEGSLCSDAAFRPQNQPGSVQELEQVLPSTRRRTGSITSLTLAVPVADPNVAELLFLWPRCLREVVFSEVVHSPYMDIYTASTIENLLAIHRQTLEKLDIQVPFKGLLNTSSFPALHSLRTPISSLLPQNPEEAWRHLAAPNLHHLTIDFTAATFEASTSTWIKDFLAHPTNLPVPLKLTMEYAYASWHGSSPSFFPPELQEESLPIASQHNIALVYRTPADECILRRPAWPIYATDPPPPPNWKASITRTAQMVYDYVRDPRFRHVGVRYDSIADDLDLSLAEVSFAGLQLFRSWLIQSKWDQDTWASY